MKTFLAALMLVTGIAGNLYGQKNKSAAIFDIPESKIYRIFFIDLGKGNKIKLEIQELSDLDAIYNIDSVLKIFMQDMEPLKDSISNELTSKKIDYLIDPSGKNKIRIQQTTAGSASYLVNQGSVAALKMDQDTLNILFTISKAGKKGTKNSEQAHLCRVSFIVNNLGDLSNYPDGQLQSRIIQARVNANNKWVNGKDGMMHIKAIPSISAATMRGQTGTASDFLNLRLTSDIQNYKNYFVPSLSFGLAITTNRASIRREFSLMSESHFSFIKNDQGKTATYRNTFLTVGYSQINSNKERSALGFNPSFSFGYLLRQRGNLYDKNTFRIGFGRVTFFGEMIKIEPVIYFHDFFKGITPGIRLSL